ncbi:MAG: hypothetical protein FWD02_05735 [Bacteroidales bacterium]|nr:hypothetical protein [Bacteroidales bacterium]
MKRARKYVLWTFGGLFALFITVSAVVYFAVLRDSDRIKNIILGELNRSLTGEVTIKRMSFTFWSSFPHVALDFRNVRAMSPNPNDLEPLLDTRSLSLNFNLRDMIAGRYEVRRIDLNDATVRIKLYADGTANFNLWQPIEDANFSFSLQRINIRNTHLTILAERTEQHYEFYIYRANARGDFSQNIQNIAFSGDFHLNFLQSRETVILAEKDMSLRTQIVVDATEQAVHFLDGFIRLEDLNFDLSGFVNYSDDAPNMNLELVGRHLNLQRFARQLPAEFAHKIESYRTRGDFDFRLVFSGDYTQGNLPQIAAEFEFRDGQIFERNTRTQLNQVGFSGTFSTTNSNQLSNYRLQIRNFSARTATGYITANFAINNFQSPTIQLNTAFNIGLDELNRLVSAPQILSASGQSIGQIQYRHTFKNFESISLSEILRGQFQGTISCRNTVIKLQDSILRPPVKLDTIHIDFNQNRLHIPFAKGEFDGSRFQTSFTARDFFSHLESPELMHIFGDLSVDRYQVDKIIFQNLRGQNIHFQNQILIVDDLSVDVFDGNISGVAEVNFMDQSRFPFRFEGLLSRINAEKMFADMDNFGQSQITSENLKGLIDAEISAVGSYIPTVGVDWRTFWITMQARVSNGELNNVAMLQKLSRFVDEEALNSVRFATLENTIEIRNETITIPQMRIVSNALNLHVAGTHHFDGRIDYSVQVALSELLSRRRRERRGNQEEMGATEDERQRISLYVSITGTADNPIFRYDVRNVFRSLELGATTTRVVTTVGTAARQEGQAVGTILRDEFEFLQRSEETRRQEALWREQEQGRFVIEWDDEPEPEPTIERRRNRRRVQQDTVRIGVIFHDD